MVLVKVEWSFILYDIILGCELNVASKSDLGSSLNIGVIVLVMYLVKP